MVLGRLVEIAVALLLLSVVFGGLERWVRGRRPRGGLRRPGLRTDLLWWLSTPFLTRTLTSLGLGVALVAVALPQGITLATIQAQVADGTFPDLSLLGTGAWVRAQHLAVQLLLALGISDLLGYWLHRAFHGRRLWRIHAVHHSSTSLDWLAAVRVHPLNELFMRTLGALPLLLLGFDPAVFVAVGPIFTLYAVFLHADVDWRFGPLRYVIASPGFHRWHHSSDSAARDRNFAGLFPVWDLLFGTWYLPPEPARRFGVSGAPLPESFLGQLAYPLR